MGRKGGRDGGGRNQARLLRLLKTSERNFETPDDAIQYLQRHRKYSEYGRQKQATLTNCASKALQRLSERKDNRKIPEKLSRIRQKSELSEDEVQGGSSGFQAPPLKKPKRNDRREYESLKREIDDLRRRLGELHRESTSESSDSKSQPELESYSGGGVSTSEDAVYGKKLEPNFDMMQSLLRKTYHGSRLAEKMEENNMEVEGTNREKKLAMLGGHVSDQKSSRTTVSDGRELKGSEGEEWKAKEGPRFSDLGGMQVLLKKLENEVIVPAYVPQLLTWLGTRPTSGILLHGPPGCGKTKLAHAIANEIGLPFYQISATEVVSGVSGESEENIRELFLKAYRTAPSIIFIDEIDAIASKRGEAQREMEKRIVTQLMTCMDDSHRFVTSALKSPDYENTEGRPGCVLVIGATNRPDAIDPALRRPGRFDQEILVGVPDENGRVEILSALTSKVRLEGTLDLLKIARVTPGFVGADLEALVNKAGNLAVKGFIEQLKLEHGEGWWRQPLLPEDFKKLSITMADFEEAAEIVQPSSRREGFSEIPNVKWEDVGGLNVLRQEFKRHIIERIKFPKVYEVTGADLAQGFLLYGPPGCGKTLIAMAVANEAGANFIHIKGPELLSKYVGDSERAIRTTFNRARRCSPCIVFFDEVDALTKERGKDGEVVERLLNQLLIELDGGDKRPGVYVIGATNRPDVMDRALLRPGRFGKHLYVPLPSPEERGLILKALGRKKKLDADVDLLAIGKSNSCAHFSGADLSALMNEAATTAAGEIIEKGLPEEIWSIKAVHFEKALQIVTPSVSAKERRSYRRLSRKFCRA